MTPGLRTRCAIAVVSFLLLTAARAGAVEVDPGAPAAHRPPAAPSASLAGHPAGEGRPRPGLPPVSAPPAPPDAGAAEEGGAAQAPSPGESAALDPTVAATPTAAASVSQSRPGSVSGPPPDGASSTREPPERERREHRPERPGSPRSDDVPEDGEGAWDERDAAAVPLPSGAPLTPAAARQQVHETGPSAPVPHRVSPLSLGVGMALMGLGIGFLGIRMRRR
ncbi:hypothetical protein [Streptomyces clavuligerus]|uniref:hypothetical protein n=1 Tax=Streptomyces clavuligerus TaxID=1901 RepID=UPI0001851BCE|nr:hypothetical protein [Streptomyces clavuligerus]WDN52946.1 hypothetical protein LL058_14420 [Streptomyces clavuligerus]